MGHNEVDDIPYRSPMRQDLPAVAVASSQDEANYSTLKTVQAYFHKAIEDLYKDFNAFSVIRGAEKEIVADDLVIQVLAKQEAYRILVTASQQVDSAIDTIDSHIKA